jgi:fido (protein-threonine AMPylation protein)
MLPPMDCLNWEYDNHPARNAILPVRCVEWLTALAKGHVDPQELSYDTRPAHLYLFKELTPDDCKHHAGHYRGEDYNFLKLYNVFIAGDSRVGSDASVVFNSMENLKEAIELGMTEINEAYQVSDEDLPRDQKIIYLVKFATRILVEFLRIHPYANGNGHMARLIIFTLLFQHKLWPKNWPFDESPSYHQLIASYRDGIEKPLDDFILESVLGI